MNKKSGWMNFIMVWALALGCIIGWGAFVMPGTTFLKEAGPVGAIIGIVLSMFLMIIIALNYAYLTGALQVDGINRGGSYIYAKSILGYDHGFLAAWAIELAYISLLWANSTTFTMIAGYMFGDALQWGFHYQIAGYDIYFGEIMITMLIDVVLAMLICFCPKLTMALRTIMGIAVFVFVIILFVLIAPSVDMPPAIDPPFAEEGSTFVQIFDIVVLAPWLFVGYEIVTHMVGNIKLSTARIYVAAILAIVAGAVIYVCLLLIASVDVSDSFQNWNEYIGHLDRLSGVQAIPVIYVCHSVLGTTGDYLILGAIFCTLTTSVIGFYVSSVRILQMMAEDNLVPKKFGEEVNGVPRRAVISIMLISLLVPFLGRTAVGWNADVATLSVSIVYAYISICSAIIAKRNDNKWNYILGIIGTIISGMIFAILLVPNIFTENVLASESYFMLSVWSLVGIIYYWRILRKDDTNRFGKSTVMWIVMLFVLFFSSNMWMRLATEEAVFGLVEESRIIDAVLIKNNLIQILIMMVALVILFNLFNIMLRREKELDIKIIREKERNKAKTSLLSNVSHDIRTPMNAIIGYTNLALMNNEEEDEIEGYLKNIKTSSEYLMLLLSNVLEMSQIENGKIELQNTTTNLEDMLRDLQVAVMPQINQKEQTLEVDVDIRNKKVLCDKGKLQRILMNLISNANKYTHENGTIEVKLKQEEVTDHKARYVYTVKDNGIGMSEEFVSKIFEAFERENYNSDSGVQGTGLGMAITKSFVELMGGDITVDTKEGVGTVFTVTFAFEILAEDATESREQLFEEKVKRLAEKNVLVADDIDINRKILWKLLAKYGMHVYEAKDGMEVLDLLDGHRIYDIILLDIHMPNMDGYEVARKIRNLKDSSKSQVPMIAVTADAFSHDIKKAMEAGMNGYITKPIDTFDLISKMDEVLNES